MTREETARAREEIAPAAGPQVSRSLSLRRQGGAQPRARVFGMQEHAALARTQERLLAKHLILSVSMNFQTAAFDHSATSPRKEITSRQEWTAAFLGHLT